MKQTTLTATIWREDDSYVSLCSELGVSSFGNTPDEAIDMLRDAVELYLENAHQLGIWEDIRAVLESPHHFTAPLEVAVP
ncbi:MAG: type II toxin-antitoxin system HicB family antitoxin [Anaerolineales bacterium]|nr:type II toxin-antitoxin system HicB family antitoxin [Anaerolineales bacterium]